MNDQNILDIIEIVVQDIDYDEWKYMFEYYEPDHNYDGSRYKSTRERLLRDVKDYFSKRMLHDCGAIDCVYNSRCVDKFGHGQCLTNFTLDSKGRCFDYDVYNNDDLKMVFGEESTHRKMTRRLVEPRETSFDKWTDWHNEIYAKLVEQFGEEK